MPTIDEIPTWKLILVLLKDILVIAIPIVIIAVCIIAFMRTCGDMPY